MGVDGVSPMVDIAVSGLRAQSLRLNLISANIANAETTHTATGRPYRRQDVVLATTPENLGGVTVISIARDQSAFQSVLIPGHPDADEQGYVEMPNVQLPTEMMNLVFASRAYEANVAVLKRYQDMVEATIELLR
ncbi:MAG TPA: flagellar basal body rod protein FlgC [Phycisphaerae bacterium]|nr:flagellar basal body rod protein FlgC [Phycisphaerae bacterium]